MALLLLTICCILVIILLVLKLYLKITSGMCKSKVNLAEKTAVITGGNTGIGYQTAADLLERGAKVIIACRNEEKAKDAVERLIRETKNTNATYKILDLASLKSVRKFAQDIIASEERLDILINNAGLHRMPGAGFTEDKLQPIMATNYFGHFLLTNLLLDLLKKSTPSRIINVGSLAGSMYYFKLENLNEAGIVDHTPYFRSKLCNIFFTIELAKKLKGTGVTTYSLHPGVILSEFTRNIPFKIIVEFVIRWFFKDSIEGAQTTIHCAVADDIGQYSGEHFHDCHVVPRYRAARNAELPSKVWKRTEDILNIL